MDNGGEFISSRFETLFKACVIIPHYTAPYTPQQNPFSERGNCSTTEKARAPLKHAKLCDSLWGEAVFTAVFYENIFPLKRNTLAAFILGHQRPFDYACLWVFGCREFVNIPKKQRLGKFSDTLVPGILLEYQIEHKNWMVLLPNMSVKYSHNVIFHEDFFPGNSFFNPVFPVSPGFSSLIDITASCDSLPVEHSFASPTPNNAVSSHISPPMSPGGHLNEPPTPTVVWPGWDIVVQPLTQKACQEVSSLISSNNIPVEAISVAYALPNVPPKMYQQALVLANSEQWLMAIHLEKQLLEKKHVWEAVSTPPNIHLLNTVLVFKCVFNGDGNLVKHKAHLCAQGYSQIPGLEYGNNYSPTRAMETL
ncbi:hypothetical protein O181_024357 [Austropuccinia psidii MF-1]|uniref:Integrase catalytic domain-containing protein n=1 Tax=Austropuccinia psidii MF-1 TaxID=1389203 RepID=A0A9Q3CJ66_9BASI|nr:hypothetical protein [Austropuccinia psidii MF-1]